RGTGRRTSAGGAQAPKGGKAATTATKTATGGRAPARRTGSGGAGKAGETAAPSAGRSGGDRRPRRRTAGRGGTTER
ncbi:DEAD/DEAH box helicase, partial [Streptomyces sp. NPDC057854]